MTIIDFYFTYALLISNALLLAAAVLAILKFQRLQLSSSEFWNSPTGSVLREQSDQDTINQLNDDRLALLQEAVDRIERTNLEQDLPQTEILPFENAVRMAKAGASLEDLVRTCGLSNGEARLFLKVHARSAA